MIKAEVRFTEKHFNVLMKTRKTSWVTYLCGFFIFALLAMLVVSNIYEGGFSFDSIKPLIIWAVIVGVILWLKYLASPKRQLKNYQKNFPNAANTYCFDEEKFSLSSVSDVSSGTSEYVYESIESAEETNGFFKIKIKGVGIMIIGSEEITEGTPEVLRELLKNKLGSKFKSEEK